MNTKSETERLARMVRLDQVDSLELVSAKTGIPAEKLAERWQSSSSGDSARTSGGRVKPLARPKGTVPRS
ncbi:MAG TPA: hypothetical protein VFC10_09215 [Terriglobia bacterium]|nr:hypothetical protein [Terriglobia bacterium]